ncbi:MAG: rod shape-determining protein MreC [Candidatus Wildermuthbacteria bacterium]|nr:rod shape-determining protein MreC [Candidatus Wildermuthbacteria bacterium]
MRGLFRQKKFIFFLLLLAGIFALNLISPKARSFFYALSSPFQAAAWKAGGVFSDFLLPFREGKDLRNDNERLTEDNVVLRSELAKLQDIKRENEQLRSALNLGIDKEFEFARVEIIGKHINEDVFIVRVPEGIDLKENMSVITPTKIAAGKIRSVNNGFAEVILLSHPASSIDVRIPDKNITAVVKGKGHFKVELDLVQQQAELAKGDTIVTSSLGGVFPKNIFVGVVEKPVKSDVEAFQTAIVSQTMPLDPLFSVYQYDFLFVITGIK